MWASLAVNPFFLEFLATTTFGFQTIDSTISATRWYFRKLNCWFVICIKNNHIVLNKAQKYHLFRINKNKKGMNSPIHAFSLFL